MSLHTANPTKLRYFNIKNGSRRICRRPIFFRKKESLAHSKSNIEASLLVTNLKKYHPSFLLPQPVLEIVEPVSVFSFPYILHGRSIHHLKNRRVYYTLIINYLYAFIKIDRKNILTRGTCSFSSHFYDQVISVHFTVIK